MSLPTIIPSSPIVNIDVSQGNKVILLPAASTVTGNTYTIRDWRAACGPSSIYVSSIGLDSIDGVRQLVMTSTLEVMKVMSLGNTSWSLLNRNKTVTSNLKIIALLPTNIVFASSSFGSLGTITAAPTWNWTSTGGVITYYTITLYADTNNPPTTSVGGLTPPTASATSYTFPGATVIGYYYKLVVTAFNSVTNSSFEYTQYNNITPVLSYSSFSWVGTQGSTSAQPRWNWSVTAGTVASYTVTLLADTSNPPTTAISVSQPASSATSYTFPGTTVLGYYYKFSLTATNSAGTSSAITDQEYNNVTPVLSYSSFSWVGTQGSTSAQPRWNWSVTAGTIASYTVTLLADTSNPPTTAISVSQPSAGATSYTYPGATVTGYYYKFSLTATNPAGTSSAITDQEYNNVTPVLSYSSFSWGGSQGSTSAQPTWNWSVTSGTVASYTVTLLADTSNPPTTAISVSQPSAGATSYTYSGATVAGYYYKFSLTATNPSGTSSAISNQAYNNVAPVLSYSSFSWVGTQGSTSAQPRWNWSVSAGTIASYTVTLLGDTSNPPTTAISVSQPSAGATSYTYPGATVAGYYYKFSLTATNPSGTSSAITDQEYNNATPVLSYSSFSWVGTQGSTSAQPRWNWSVTSGTIASYTVTLLADTSNPPTTAITGLSQPSAGATSYTYPGATVTGYYYKFSLTATNTFGTSSAITDQEYNNVVATLSLGSFSWVGTQGSTSAQPRWNWSVTAGTVASYTVTLLGDTSNPPTTAISVSQPASSATSYTFPGATVLGYYYKFSLTATNSVGTSSAITDQEYNNVTPVLSYSSFSWDGTQGSTSAQPRWNWSVTSGTIASYTVTLLADTSNPPTTAITGLSQPSASATSYTYPGATVLGYYYKFSLTATNPVGTSSAITDQEYNNVAPVLSYSSFSWVGTQGSTSAQPTWNWTVTAGTVASYTVTLKGDTNNPPTTAISVSQPASSATSYTYPGATVAGYYYKFTLTATNPLATSSAITDQEYNQVIISAPNLSGSMSFTGTLGSTDAQPTLTWSNSGGTVASYSLVLNSGSTSGLGTSLTLKSPATSDTSYVYKYVYFANGDPMPVAGSSLKITNVSGSTIIRFRLTDSYGVIGDFTGLSVAIGQTYTYTLSHDLTPNGYGFSIFAYFASGPPSEIYQVISNNGVISITTFYATFLNVGLTASTVDGYYYQLVLTGTNTGGTSTLTPSALLNGTSPPSSSSWSTGNVGSFTLYSIRSSSDGTKLVAINTNTNNTNYIYISTDSGATWQSTSSPLLNWIAIAMSSDGNTIIGADYSGSIYKSTNGGSSWTQLTNAPDVDWSCLAMSSDASILIAGINGGYIYTSTDSGTSWTMRTGSGSRTWSSIACSSDGTKIAGAAGYEGPNIYISTDSGATWTTSYVSATAYCYSVTMSSDGTKLAVGSTYGDYVYTSSNSGASWTQGTQVGANDWISIASSSDGSIIVAGAAGAYIYISYNSGSTWVQQSTVIGTGYWFGIAVSSSGTKVFAVSPYLPCAIYLGILS